LIARALHRRLPERIRGAGTLYLWLRQGPTALRVAHGMGIGTIVEGIEEEAELSWVREHGADYVQGFLLGKPAPVVRS
jgi:c-di-GMP-related signal transduction protein